MFTFLIGAASVAAMCSALLVYILIKYNMININSLAAIGASTIAGSFFLPLLKTVFIKISESVSVITGIVLSAVIFLMLTFCISYLVSTLIMDINIGKYICSLPEHMKKILESIHMKLAGNNVYADNVRVGFAGHGNINYSENVIAKFDFEIALKEEGITIINGQSENQGSITAACEEVLEFFDVNLLEDLDQCIEKAFDLKENGRSTDALNCYMRALNFNPDKDLAALIVVEVCSIYKELGQLEGIRKLSERFKSSNSLQLDYNIFNEVENSMES